MLLEVFLQHETGHGGSLAMACDDERAAIVVVLEIVVERGSNVTVGRSGKSRAHVAGILPGIYLKLQAGLAVVRHEHVGALLIYACLRQVFALDTLQHLGIVKRGKVRGTLVIARVDILRRGDVERVELLGDLWNLEPTGLLGIVGRATYIAVF